MLISTVCLHSQTISRSYNGVALTEALKELDRQQSDYDISFIYDDLRDFVITANVRAKDVPDAIRQMVVFYPISVKTVGNMVLVECGTTSHRLLGRLVDEKNQPVEYANIAVFADDGKTFITGGVSDRSGRFVIPYSQNSVVVRITRVDKMPIRRKVTSPNMGTIVMTADSKMLNAVVINEKLVRHEPGVDIVNAVQLRKGKTDLLDLLKDVPGLIVTDNSIAIPSKGSVKVMFNGRLKRISSDQLTNILKSYTASNVAKIEIIREPDAKFDAEGNYGVINIITEKQADYLGGSVGNTVNYNTKCYDAVRGNLNYQHKRITASVNGGWTYGKSANDESYVADYSTMMRKSHTDFTLWNNYYNATGSLDIMLDSLSTLGLEASYSSVKFKQIGNSTGRTYDNDGKQQEIELSHDCTSGPPRRNLNFSLYLDRNWSQAKSLSFIMDVFRLNSENNYSFDTEYADGDGNRLDKTDRVYNQNSRKLHGVSAALDFKTLLPWNISLATGIKTTLSSTENSLHYEYSTLPMQNDDFTYEEDVHAAYATLSKQVERISLRLGGRYEFTHTKAKPQSGENTVNDYGRFYPNIAAIYRYDKESSIELTIRSGLNRPQLGTLNPFRAYTDAYASVVGNPTLEPSYWYNVQLRNVWAFKGGEFSTSIRYAHVSNIIKQITTMNASDGTMETKWQNAYDTDGGYLDISFLYTGIKWMRASILSELIYEHSNSNSEYGLKSETDFHPYFYGLLRFFLDRQHNLSTSLTGTYSGRSRYAMGIKEKSYNVGWNVSYSCLKNRLNVNLAINNLFASNYRGTSYSNDGMAFHYDNNFSYRCLVFSASYNFGKDIRTKSKTHSSSDIKSRF